MKNFNNSKNNSNIYKQLRMSANLTQNNVAEKLYLKRSTISAWECNRTVPDQKLLPKIAELYNTTVDYLLTGKENTINIIDNLSDDEKYLVNLYKTISTKSKNIMLSQLQGISIAENGLVIGINDKLK